MKKTLRKEIYNLEFPSWCDEFSISGYRFYRKENYQTQVQKLQHLGSIQSELKIEAYSGEHAKTAYVDLPSKEIKAAFKWQLANSTALDDILFLLSLLTRREIFYLSNPKLLIRYDLNIAQSGGILFTSIPFKLEKTNDKRKYFKQVGFEKALVELYNKIRTDDWQTEFSGGYLLLLAKEAFRARTLPSAFIQCWTIWEHLFSIHNSDWLSDEVIRDLKAQEKISFILNRYFLKNQKLDNDSKKKIGELSKIRNRLIHFGKFPEKTLITNVTLFIELTEQLIATILGLRRSNIFNTVEKLEEFLAKQKKKPL